VTQLLLLLLQGEVLPPVMLRAGDANGYAPLLLLGLGAAASLTTEDWGHNTYHVSMACKLQAAVRLTCIAFESVSQL
jgi:hypothetical protein